MHWRASPCRRLLRLHTPVPAPAAAAERLAQRADEAAARAAATNAIACVLRASPLRSAVTGRWRRAAARPVRACNGRGSMGGRRHTARVWAVRDSGA